MQSASMSAAATLRHSPLQAISDFGGPPGLSCRPQSHWSGQQGASQSYWYAQQGASDAGYSESASCPLGVHAPVFVPRSSFHEGGAVLDNQLAPPGSLAKRDPAYVECVEAVPSSFDCAVGDAPLRLPVTPGDLRGKPAAMLYVSGEYQDADDVRGTTAVATNPGSVGHPELCPRPCLYFASGNCTNGSSCEFCHLQHDKRPAHLDKRCRGALQAMSFPECAALVMPIMSKKATQLGLCLEAYYDLQRTILFEFPSGFDMSSTAAQALPATLAIHGKVSSMTKVLQRTLQALNLRSLIRILHRSIAGRSSPIQAALDALAEQFRARFDDVN